MASRPNLFTRSDYTIGWICAIQIEIQAAKAALDEEHPNLPAAHGDDNIYMFGSIGPHNVVVAWLPSNVYGSNAAAVAATNMKRSFENLRFGLMVGVGGGAPSFPAKPSSTPVDIRLGDIVVGVPQNTSPGVIQYDLGKVIGGGTRLVRTGTMNKPPVVLLNAVQGLKTQLAYSADSHSAQLSTLVDRLPQTLQPQFSYQGAKNDVLFKYEYNMKLLPPPAQNATNFIVSHVQRDPPTIQLSITE